MGSLVRMRTRDGAIAGVVAAVLSGVPSTAHAVATGADPLQATRAAGTILVGEDASAGMTLLAAVPLHLALSLFWAVLLALALPTRTAPWWGTVVGLAIAAFDLGVIGRAFPAIMQLPLGPQLADHAAFGLTVGWMVRWLRRRRVHG